tara:strand:+ start:115 stop:570 length:456 start_codon:yes stop_codon:yes gene_type:complete
VFSTQDKLYMSNALDLARLAFELNEVPIGAIIIYEGEIIGKGHNNVIGDNDVTSHAEINAIRDASKNFGNYRLTNCTMYVTLEPCHMCAKAIVDARLKSLIYAANEPKTGSIQSIDNFLDNKFLNHKVLYKSGLFKEESSRLLKEFFTSKR